MPIVSYYWRAGAKILNFGEHFAEIIPSLMGVKIIPWKDGKYSQCLLTIGSCFHNKCIQKLLNQSQEIYIWGTGNGVGKRDSVDVSENDRIKVFSCRGHLTKKWNNVNPSVPVADPLFILPILRPERWRGASFSEIVYAPHWENRKGAVDRMSRIGANSYFNVFIRRDSIRQETERLLNANFVLANTLHVVIYCLAYRIPFAPLLTSKEKLNFPSKWADVFDWLGVDLTFVRNYAEGRAWWKSTGRHIEIPSVKEAMDAFPFRPLRFL